MSILSATTQKQVEDKLLTAGLVQKSKLDQIKKDAESKHMPFLALLVSSGLISNEQLTKTIAQINKIPYVNLTDVRIEPEVLNLLSEDIAKRYMAVPLGEMQNRLVIAMLDADNVQAVDFLANKIGRPVKVYAASEEGIQSVLKQYGAAIDKTIGGEFADTLNDIESAANPVAVTDSSKNIKTIVQDSPITKALTTILEYAAKNRASDIHMEPLEKVLKIRCRIDGVLREIMKLPKSTEPPLVSRIKILSNLKIDEHRIPQDGQFSIQVDQRQIDLRIAISPVVWGEQVVIRLLDKTINSFELEEMGYRGRSLRTIQKGLKQTSGMILTSGPTGSGKSTSMYALIQQIKDDSINIVTLEDPVEYKIESVNQIQVNPDVGLTFASGLRSVLRQDPDVVMVGEIRDKETATLAIQAALTGHLVFSTLHTNSAAGILPRLLDMGIEPFLIASTVHTVIGQRLVRRIADKTKEAYECDEPEAEAIHHTIGHLLPDKESDVAKVSKDLGFDSLPLRNQTAYTLYKGKDSPDTPGGYKDRMGLYEVFEINEEIQKLIVKQAATGEIQRAAEAQGMVTMRQDGYLKALAGYTTINEVNRVAAADSE